MKLCEVAQLCDAIECDGYRFEGEYGDYSTLDDKLVLSDGNEWYEFANCDFDHPAGDTNIEIFDLSGTLRTLAFLQIDVRVMTMGQLTELHAQQRALKPT